MEALSTAREIDETDQRSPVLAVVDQIVEAIREGQLAPGQRLVEADFAKTLGVARSTVREAFQRLEVEGLLSQERHRGFLVKILTRDHLREIYQIRETLDGLAARLATPEIQRDCTELQQHAEALEKASAEGNLRDFTQHNRAFHDLIRRKSGNALLFATLRSLDRSVYYFQFRLLVEHARVFETQHEHREIFEALRSGNADAAEEASRRHVRHALAELLQLPDRRFVRAP